MNAEQGSCLGRSEIADCFFGLRRKDGAVMVLQLSRQLGTVALKSEFLARSETQSQSQVGRPFSSALVANRKTRLYVLSA